jgi:hypothetical protein
MPLAGDPLACRCVGHSMMTDCCGSHSMVAGYCVGHSMVTGCCGSHSMVMGCCGSHSMVTGCCDDQRWVVKVAQTMGSGSRHSNVEYVPFPNGSD